MKVNGRELDAIICDAAGYAFEKDRARGLARILAAAVDSAPDRVLRVSQKAVHAYSGYGTPSLAFDEDQQTGDLLIRVKESR